MATGITALEKTQIGVEALAGSSTDVPTTTWRGNFKLKDTQQVVFPPERVGIFGPTTRSYVPITGSEGLFDGDATYEQLNYFFNAGIYTTTPTTDTGSGYIRTWTVQNTSADLYATTDLGTLVVENGDNIQVLTSRFNFVREMALSGKQGEGMMVTATSQGRDPSTSAGFTAVGSTDLENPAETILFSKVSLAIDPSTDTAGTTPKTETILDSTLNFKTGWVANEARDGRTDFSNIKRTDDEITLDVTFEHNGVATAERDAFKAQTERVIQLKFLGTALSAAGTYTYKTFIMNLWGKWQTFGSEGLEEQNGDNIYRGTFKVAYSAAAASKAQFILVTDQVTLP